MKNNRTRIIVAALAVAASVLTATSIASAHPTKAAASVSCSKTFTLPFITPLTGAAGFLGQEQLLWAKYAIATLPKQYGLKMKLEPADVPVEVGPAPAQTLAQKFVADSSVVATLGPSTSGSVVAANKTFSQAGIAQVSPSATRTDLTQKVAGVVEADKTFFRVVPGDYIQGPADAAYMINKLNAKKVVIFDFQEPYSQGLAAAVDAVLKAHGVTTIHLSVANTVTDFSSFVTRIPDDTDVVFFPTQTPPAAQSMAEQLLEQGKKAKVFGGDGSNAPAQFKVPGSYVSNFAAPIGLFAYNKPISDGYLKANPGKTIGSFGPPTYGAIQVILSAIKHACTAEHGTLKSRADIIPWVKKVQIKNWILGGNFAFSPSTNDPHNAKFVIFQIQSNGSYKLVG